MPKRLPLLPELGYTWARVSCLTRSASVLGARPAAAVGSLTLLVGIDV